MNQIRERIELFILNNFLFDDTSRMPDPTDSLIGTSVMDSTGVLELIEFLESAFSVQVEDDETTPENLDSIENLVRFVTRKVEDGVRHDPVVTE